MVEEMKCDISEEEVCSALNDKEQEAEELLKDAEKASAPLDAARNLLDKIQKMPVIGGLADDIKTTIELIGDYVKGDYREIPFRIIVSALGAIIYLVSPFDLIPDFIPVFGFLEDAAVLTLVLGTGLSLELRKYREWKEETHNHTPKTIEIEIISDESQEGTSVC